MFNFFKKNNSTIQEGGRASFEIELTAAVLAYEIARIDGIVSNAELDVLMEEIKKISKKVDKEESEIIKIIEIYSNDSVSFFEFVEDINKNYSKEEKLSLLAFMWRIAYADGKLEVDEERLIRRLADLIKIKDLDVLKLKDQFKS
jgi:uncharacterized tellurite resistance protein B-like protein|tara:strand:+ start:423 stop:857 length:435 start_codon:yes stop_codon:yes gene_type:complete